MACERDRFLADAFHQAAVARQHIGEVIDDVGAEAGGEDAFGERKAHRVAEALAERPGRGLDAGRVAIFGMAGGLGAELAEVLDLVERHVRVAGEIKHRIEQHRAVAGRQDEAIAVGPVRIERIELQEFGEKDRGDVGHAHRQAGMAGVGLFDGIHGKGSDRVRHVAGSGGLFGHFIHAPYGFFDWRAT